MAMSRDRVRFTLVPRYFCGSRQGSGMDRYTCIEVLNKAFGGPGKLYVNWESAMADNDRGLDIVCRPSQFARFIVYRHEMGNCINGVKDLNPKLIAAQPTKLFDVVADNLCLPAAEFAFEMCEAMKKAGIKNEDVGYPNAIDVSTNEHRHPI